MQFKPNPQGMRDLEKKLSKRVAVPLKGSESAAMSAVKRDYERQAGAKLSDEAARNIVRQARGQK